MDSDERKAAQLMQEAEKKVSSAKGFFSSIFSGGGSRADDAADLYVQAANLYKKHQKWSEAGDAFYRVAKLKESNVDQATSLVEAGNCLKHVDTTRAMAVLGDAVDKYTDMGRFSLAAKQHVAIAELCEQQQPSDLERAIQHYQRAADYYTTDESHAAANKCLLKVAEYAAQAEDYMRAIAIYDQVAGRALTSQLLKYSVKDYYFNALLCHMCVDVTNGANALANYQAQCPAFQDSRECKLIKTLINKLEEDNVDEFTSAVVDYDSISRLNPWPTMMLNRIKKTFREDLT